MFSEQQEVNQEGIELAQGDSFGISRVQGKMVMVSLIKPALKSAEKHTHGDIHFTVTIIHGGVKNEGMTICSRQKIACPKITVQ